MKSERAIESANEIQGLTATLSSNTPDEAEIASLFKIAARQYRQFCLRHPARLRMIRRAATEADTSREAAGVLEQIVQAIASFGRSGTGTQTENYEARIHMTLAAMHGFVDAELEGFIDSSHDPDRLFDELVHRCLAPFDQLPSSW